MHSGMSSFIRSTSQKFAEVSLDNNILDEIKNFFENYKTLQKIEVKVGSYHNKEEALRLIETCKERYKKETGDDNG